ncbi:RING-type domain-containing protein [Caenorhabditis elegans]|uniref:RING-type domain-containing protein n=1 Tax=Caenorhabditis elegans TaxID=6239 RepID=Q20940_CAEEL|nr:RING-type domain-containing protein [Caenorhabditis elegans]CCD69446.2 RING-type domain-containing protein [Caenorhabditis elegans]|eukprot:NP_508118.2 Uncharacterized protein CELE_F57C12.2 [Caenorhabditis elegans]
MSYPDNPSAISQVSSLQNNLVNQNYTQKALIQKYNEANLKVENQKKSITQLHGAIQKLKMEKQNLETQLSEKNSPKTPNVTENMWSLEYESKLSDAKTKIENQKKEINKLNEKVTQLKEEQQNSNQLSKNNESDMRNENRLAEVRKVQENVWRQEVEKLSVTGAQQVVTISNLSNENRQLREENSTLKLLYNENTAQVNTLAMISAALSSNEESVNRNLQPTPTHVENELQDTECAICKEEMRFPKCTTCRKKFHERCLQQWTCINPTCPACRTTMTLQTS